MPLSDVTFPQHRCWGPHWGFHCPPSRFGRGGLDFRTTQATYGCCPRGFFQPHPGRASQAAPPQLILGHHRVPPHATVSQAVHLAHRPPVLGHGTSCHCLLQTPHYGGVYRLGLCAHCCACPTTLGGGGFTVN